MSYIKLLLLALTMVLTIHVNLQYHFNHYYVGSQDTACCCVSR